MADWLGFEQAYIADESYTAQFSATTSASANTKGAWSEFDASLANDCYGLMVVYRNYGTSKTCLVDIGVGAGGAEQVIIPNLCVALYMTAGDCYTGYAIYPTFIPAGTRVAFRAQASAGSQTVYLGFLPLYAGSLNQLPRVGTWTDYGTDTANSRGTALTLPSSGNGSWAQLSASTADDIRLLIANAVSYGGSSTWEGSIQIGVGGAGAEQVLVTIPTILQGNTLLSGPVVSPAFPVSIPAGSRLAARAVFITGTTGPTATISVLGAS